MQKLTRRIADMAQARRRIGEAGLLEEEKFKMGKQEAP